jgi:hypothetical protein
MVDLQAAADAFLALPREERRRRARAAREAVTNCDPPPDDHYVLGAFTTMRVVPATGTSPTKRGEPAVGGGHDGVAKGPASPADGTSRTS